MNGENTKASERDRSKQRRLANYVHLGDIHFEISLELGRKELSLRDAARLQTEDIVELDKLAGEPFELRANGQLFAEGEVVVVTDLVACRITRMVPGP